MNLEDFRNSIKKPADQDLPFGEDKEAKKEQEADIKWEFKVGDGVRDRTGEEGEIRLVYDNGKCTIDGKEVPFQAFIFAVGPNKHFLKEDTTFQKILEVEKDKE